MVPALVGDAHTAFRTGLAPEDEDHDETIRQIIFRTRRGLPYRALFLVRGNDLFVLRIRGPGQDLVAPGDLNVPP